MIRHQAASKLHTHNSFLLTNHFLYTHTLQMYILNFKLGIRFEFSSI